MLNDTDKRNKAAQIVIAKALLKLADTSKDQPEQLKLLHSIAEAISDSQFYFLSWPSIESYLHLLAYGDIDFDENENEIHTPGINDPELRTQIEADIAKTTTELD